MVDANRSNGCFNFWSFIIDNAKQLKLSASTIIRLMTVSEEEVITHSPYIFVISIHFCQFQTRFVSYGQNGL